MLYSTLLPRLVFARLWISRIWGCVPSRGRTRSVTYLSVVAKHWFIRSWLRVFVADNLFTKEEAWRTYIWFNNNGVGWSLASVAKFYSWRSMTSSLIVRFELEQKRSIIFNIFVQLSRTMFLLRHMYFSSLVKRWGGTGLPVSFSINKIFSFRVWWREKLFRLLSFVELWQYCSRLIGKGMYCSSLHTHIIIDFLLPNSSFPH